MTDPERTRYKNIATVGPSDSTLPKLEIGERGNTNFAVLDIVEGAGGERFVRKWPEFGMNEATKESFNYFISQLPNHPFLQRHFPPTIIKENGKGTYYIQGLVEASPGKSNMADLYNPAEFDLDQIDSPKVLGDIMAMVSDGIAIFETSLHHPKTEEDESFGWFPEFRPDALVQGKRPGDTQEEVYLVDCHPILPVTQYGVQQAVSKLYNSINETARQKFGITADDIVHDRAELSGSLFSQYAGVEASGPKRTTQTGQKFGKVVLAA